MNRKLKLQELGRMDVPAFKEADKVPITVLLDNIRSLNNIGSVFRTADAFRIEEVILCGYTARPPHRDITRTALGATESVTWQHIESATEAVTSLKEKGYKVLAVEQAQNTTLLHDFTPSSGQAVAIVLGNEVEGVQQSVIDACDGCLEIPQFGTKHSLNVSVCAGVVLYELYAKMAAWPR